MTARKIVLIFALALLAIAALRDLGRLGDALPWHRQYDFADFYCAGSALAQHADPYRYEPLHRCEHAVNPSKFYRQDPARVVPAPLPPYDFPPFQLAARAPFSLARSVDAVAIVLAVLAAIVGLSRLRIPFDVAVLALALPAGYLLLDAGQIVPFALAVLVFCGVALAHRRDDVAGTLAALTLVEPHLGLPVCAALMLLVPASRPALLLAGLFLIVVGELVTGTSVALEYIAHVLPAQASAEAAYAYQYSLSYLLVVAGLPARAALTAGAFSYVAVAALGIWLGAKLASALQRRELLAFLPAACAVVGGSYVHMVDLAVAIPAALVLASSLRGAPRTAAAISLCLLCVPWIDVWITKKLFLASLFVVAALLVRLQIDPAASITTFGVVAATIYLFELHPPAPLVALTGGMAFRAGDLAERAWAAYVAALQTTSGAWLAIKIPTWAALTTLLAAALRAVRRPNTGHQT